MSVITAVIPVSVIPSHPETDILEETVHSIRHHLPDAEIIVTFDGVRAEQESRRAAYEESIRRTLWLADKAWGNVCPFVFDKHTHQVGMMRAVIDEIRTPLLVYVEQDTPLCTDVPIDWAAVTEFISSGRSELVRFHFESVIPTPHQHMMHGMEPGAPFLRTSQYSARPHVATVAFYRRLLTHFTPEANTFLEDKLHGVCSEAFILDGINGWRQFPMHIWHPEGSIKASYHLDGRAGADKYDDQLVF